MKRLQVSRIVHFSETTQRSERGIHFKGAYHDSQEESLCPGETSTSHRSFGLDTHCQRSQKQRGFNFTTAVTAARDEPHGQGPCNQVSNIVHASLAKISLFAEPETRFRAGYTHRGAYHSHEVCLLRFGKPHSGHRDLVL